jgi:hypothetical protein
MHASAVIDLRDSFGAAFVGLLFSTTSVLPLALLSWYFSLAIGLVGSLV